MFTAWAVTGKPDVGYTINGVLAGLVGITAGTAAIGFSLSIVTGLVAGALMVGSVIFLERRGVDDPVGAISVHGTAGLWGVVAVALFSGGASLGIQLVGAAAIIVWAFVTSYLVFKVIDVTVGMRVTKEEELAGLDISEHGSDAYPEFVFQHEVVDLRTNGNGSHAPSEVAKTG